MPPNADDPSTTVNLSILMVLESLAYLDMKSQTLNIMAWFQIDWHDPTFSWDTHRYPVDMVVVSEKEVWRPVLAIANTLLPRDQIMKIELPVSLFSDGSVRWFPGDSFLMTCHMNLNFYPFDTQTCKVRLSQWSHHVRHFNCTQAAIRSPVKGNGEWDITDLGFYYDVTHEADYSYWILTYTITLQRKWGYYAINLIFPIILVSALNNVVFLLHVDSGDKMAVSVTTFLTLIVFLTMINDSLAKNSDTVCYLSLYLAVQMTLGALAVVQSAIVVACHHRASGDQNPKRDFKRKLSCINQQVPDQELPDAHRLNEDGDSVKVDNWIQSTNHDEFSGVMPKTRYGQSTDRTASERTRRRARDMADSELIGSKRTSRDWTVIAARIDSICFPVFVGLNVMSLLVFSIVILSA
ncbi:hypothetical protein ACOMHN_019671 [Nucella lapillus]